MSSSPRVMFWIPMPPPYAGPEVASKLLADACRAHLPDIAIENASLRASNTEKGRFDWDGIAAFARAYTRFVRGARTSRVVYLTAAANYVGCLRDAVLINTARTLGCRIVLHFRGGRYGEFYEESSVLMKQVLRASWGAASCAIVQTPRLGRALAVAAPHVPVEVLPNGLPTNAFPNAVSRRRDGLRILFVGHLTFPKGFYDLARSFPTIRERFPAATLACAGELPSREQNLVDFLPSHHRAAYLTHRHEVCDHIRRFVTSSGVEYAGVVSGNAKHELFAAANVFVLPSYTEGFSVAVLEAMFHGLPIVATRVGGLPDIIEHGVNGFLVEPGDVGALTHAITTLLENPELRIQMGTRNAHEARERYALEIVARRLAEICRRVAGTADAPASTTDAA